MGGKCFLLKTPKQSRAACLHNEFTAVIERDGDWYVACCPEVPEANGQGRTKDEANQNLIQAVALVLEDRRADGT